MSEKKQPYTLQGLILGSYKMATQNNAILRLMMKNQALIMEKLNIDFDASTFHFSSQEQLPETVRLQLQLLLEHLPTYESLSNTDAWDFALENDSNLDIDDLLDS